MENGGLRQSQQIAIYANAIAVALANKLTLDEENIVGNLLTQIGASLLTIAAIDASEQSDSGSTEDGQTK